jgi:predicted O-linked N-acetylglucosamine transferase (SPINDLY family)
MNELELLQQGLDHHNAGRSRDAAECYQRVLRSNSNQPDALYLLGVLSHQNGHQEAAIELMRRAIRVAGDQPRLHEVLGLALMSVERFDEAGASLARAAESGTPESFNNLGILRKKQERFDDAIAAFERAIDRNPSFPDGLYNLGNAHRAKNELETAARCFRRALAVDPQHANALAALSQTLRAQGERAENVSEFADAAAFYRAALSIDPAALDPAYYEVKHNLAHALFELGQADEALDLFREAARGPRSGLPRAMIAVMIPGAPKATNQDVLAARREFAENDLPSLRPSRARQPKAPLRIGYVSSFLHRQNWMKPVWSLIARHDRSRFEVHLFSDAAESAVPEAYRAGYHDISALGNEAAARLIEENAIDVLVDLNGYSKIARLPLFMLRPAPVIVGWFNMFATTGMPCYDYLIGDDHVIPPAEEPFYCEKILRAPGSYLTFDVTYSVPDVTDPPCLTAGAVTFGCLAPLYKITPRAIAAWAQILRESPRSSLVLRGSALKSEGARRYIAQAFGPLAERVRLYGPADHYEFLETYNQIDIALDTFPYNGGTTTTEAIWQGVPVVTFWGDRWVSRTSASILRAGNLGRFVNRDLEGYIAQAIALANSPGELPELRRNMRAGLRASPVCDGEAFALNMERIYSSIA